MSDETAQAIINGPWAGDEVEITPLREFIAQFRIGALSPKEWRNVDSNVMPILVELARESGVLDDEIAQDPKIAAAFEEQEHKLSQSWPTIEDLLDRSSDEEVTDSDYESDSVSESD